MTKETRPPVGYCSPPVHSQFKKGRSGNPKGRPRKREDMHTILKRVLDRKLKVRDGDAKLPIREALIRKLRELTLSGDSRALKLQQDILLQAGYGTKVPETQDEKRKRIIRNFEKMGITVIMTGPEDQES